MYVPSVLVCTKDILVCTQFVPSVLVCTEYILVCTKYIWVHTWLYCTQADPCFTGFRGARRDANTGGPDVQQPQGECQARRMPRCQVIAWRCWCSCCPSWLGISSLPRYSNKCMFKYNLQDVLGFPDKADQRAEPGTGWTPAELNHISSAHVVDSALTTFGCVEWESQLFRGVMLARCYPFNLPKRRFHTFNPQVCCSLIHIGTYWYKSSTY